MILMTKIFLLLSNLIILGQLATLPLQAASSSASTICNNLHQDAVATCLECMDSGGFWTGLGCLSTDPVTAVGQLLGFLLGVGGLFTLMQILIGSFRLATSKGDPKGVQDAKERITNSVIALLFIMFSITILQIIGINILAIPGFFSN